MTKSDKHDCIVDPVLGIIHVGIGRVKSLAEVIKEMDKNGLEIKMDELIHEVHDPGKEIISLIDEINGGHNILARGDWLRTKSGNRKRKKKKRK